MGIGPVSNTSRPTAAAPVEAPEQATAPATDKTSTAQSAAASSESSFTQAKASAYGSAPPAGSAAIGVSSDAMYQASMSSMFQPKTTATAERDMAPIGPKEKADLNDASQKNQMLRGAGQVNPISKSAPYKNEGQICGGAAAANALVLASDTKGPPPTKAQQNADAVLKTAKDLSLVPGTNKERLTPQELDAIKSLGTGKMSAQDTQYLQEAMYKIAKRSGKSEGGAEGVGVTQMSGLMGMLAENGAFKGASVTMHLNQREFPDPKNPGKMSPADHWTCTVNGTYADSQGPGNRSMVHGGPPQSVEKQGGNWAGEVSLQNRLPPASLDVQYRRNDDKPGEYRQGTMELTGKAAYDTMLEVTGKVQNMGKYSSPTKRW